MPQMWLCLASYLPAGSQTLSPLRASLSSAAGAVVACAIILSVALCLCSALRAAAARRRPDQWHCRPGADLISVQSVGLGAGLSLELFLPEGRRCGRGALRAVTSRHVELEIEPLLLPARVGTPLQVLIPSTGAAYRFHACVLDHRLVDGSAVLLASRPPWLERVQRRRSFRARCNVPTVFAPVPSLDDGAPSHRCELYDLSGAGVCVGAPVPVPIGHALRVRLPIPGGAEQALETRVVRLSGGRRLDLPYTLHCELAPVTEEVSNTIARRCFELEQDQLRRRRSDGDRGRTPPGGP